ncbi:MAG: hypothetical protein MUE40_10050 [Anaerolineae bacterium]|jgi:hypothetical protein|nr:hypothetical protein [Anaerolineae bacterium]
MQASRQRLLGVALTTTGFTLAALAGLALSATPGLSIGTLLVGALLAFAVVLPLLVGGIYFFVRSSRTPDEPESNLPQQVAFADLMRQRGQSSLGALATDLQVPESEVLEIVQQLAALRLFSGYLTPEGTLVRLETAVVHSLSRCQTCRSPLNLAGPVTLCPVCGTEYFSS